MCLKALDENLLQFLKQHNFCKGKNTKKIAPSDTVSTYQVFSVQSVADKKLEAFSPA